MSSEYLCPAAAGDAEFVEKRSRFISRVWPVSEEAEAIALLRQTKEKHWDATHNCYAYIIRDSGATRHSDDGEPSGTAGMPILDVFLRENITNALCVVTRYFGGVLLGAGGLVRAYSHSAKIGLDAAGVNEMRLWASFVLGVPYKLLDPVRALISAHGGTEDSAEFAEGVKLTALIPVCDYEQMQRGLLDMSSGAIKPEFTGERYVGVRVK